MVYVVCSICGVCAIAVVLPEMGWKRSRHSSQIEHHGQIGQELCGSSAKRVHIRLIRRAVKRCPGARIPCAVAVCTLWRCGRALAYPRYSVNVRDTPTWFTSNCGTRVCSCDGGGVEQNRSRSDSRMLLGDASKGTTRHWPTGWTQTCKWVIYGLTPSEQPQFWHPSRGMRCNRSAPLCSLNCGCALPTPDISRKLHWNYLPCLCLQKYTEWLLITKHIKVPVIMLFLSGL